MTSNAGHVLGTGILSPAQARTVARRLVARSNSATVDARTTLARLAEQAMNEAIDQGEVVQAPPPADDRLVAARAAEAYRVAGHAGAVLVVPLRAHAHVLGALVFERGRPFEPTPVTSLWRPASPLRRACSPRVGLARLAELAGLADGHAATGF